MTGVLSRDIWRLLIREYLDDDSQVECAIASKLLFQYLRFDLQKRVISIIELRDSYGKVRWDVANKGKQVFSHRMTRDDHVLAIQTMYGAHERLRNIHWQFVDPPAPPQGLARCGVCGKCYKAGKPMRKHENWCRWKTRQDPTKPRSFCTLCKLPRPHADHLPGLLWTHTTVHGEVCGELGKICHICKFRGHDYSMCPWKATKCRTCREFYPSCIIYTHQPTCTQRCTYTSGPAGFSNLQCYSPAVPGQALCKKHLLPVCTKQIFDVTSNSYRQCVSRVTGVGAEHCKRHALPQCNAKIWHKKTGSYRCKTCIFREGELFCKLHYNKKKCGGTVEMFA